MYNSVCELECRDAGIKYFDITEISREAGFRPELIAEDGLHPSSQMYSEWVDLIVNDVKGILGKR